MNELNLVLLEPQIPQNTGNIARTCAVTGANLHLIKPFGFDITNKNLKRAGLDYWDKLNIFYYDNLEDFYLKNDGPYYYFTSKGLKVHSDVEYPSKVYLIFGREDAGLPEELLHDNPQNAIRIPMKSGLRCLNLSNSVAIATYEVLRQWNYEGLTTKGDLTKYKW